MTSASYWVKARRRCCICQRYCGVKIETDHIVPSDEGGGDEIQNAIPVCFECHAEIHSYNDRHPRGRKFQPNELRGHKERGFRRAKAIQNCLWWRPAPLMSALCKP
jgi:5-methylcytosine-specific restriction endonuclease McrA